MASVELPASPGPVEVRHQLVDFGGTLQGALGGKAQRINRLGNRWRIEVDLPPMSTADGRKWSAALVQGLRSGVLWQLRQVGLSIGLPGSPLVNGASQAGAALAVDGFGAGYSCVAGQFFSAIVSSRRYLYQVSADTAADGSGVVASLPIEPLLRVSPADDDVLEFAMPYVEGLLADAPAWLNDPGRLARGFTFAIEEVE